MERKSLYILSLVYLFSSGLDFLYESSKKNTLFLGSLKPRMDWWSLSANEKNERGACSECFSDPPVLAKRSIFFYPFLCLFPLC